MWLTLVGLALGIALGLVLNVNVSPDLARYSAVAILAGLDSVLGAIRAELDAHYDNRIFLSGFVTNTLVAVALTFVGMALRGPYWDFYWPWQSWPAVPTRI